MKIVDDLFFSGSILIHRFFLFPLYGGRYCPDRQRFKLSSTLIYQYFGGFTRTSIVGLMTAYQIHYLHVYNLIIHILSRPTINMIDSLICNIFDEVNIY